MTPYLARVIAGEVPTADEWNDHLLAFHHRYDDVTSGVVSLFRTSEGETSYQVLARRVRELAPDARDVLDIGCGDGTLLVALAREYGAGLILHGVDLSPDEIDRARKRIPAATLQVLDAATNDLGRNAYDVVVSHLVFMIMTGLRDVLVHARAALRPRGILAFVTEELSAQESIVTFARSVLGSLRTQLPAFVPIVPDREPIERDEALRALLNGAGFGDCTIERLELQAALSREQAWTFVEHTYALGLLDPSIQRELRDHVAAAFAKIAGNDATVSMTLPLRLVVARALS